MENDIIICRCQEVTRQEILDAIEQGATTVDGVKRRTRAGMGLCQERPVSGWWPRLFFRRLEFLWNRFCRRPKECPVKPVKIGILGGGENE